MGLGFSTEPSSGNSKFLPVVKFDAKAGDMIAVNREPQGDGTWEKSETEISLPVKVVVDFAAIEVGWLTFTPTYHAAMVPHGEKMPAQPTPEHKQAVRLKLFFKEHGWREFSPTSKTVLRAIDKLHDIYLEQQASNPGKMPIVTIEGTETVKVQTPQGELRFKSPKWAITGWTAAPEGGDTPAPAPKPAPQAKAKVEEFEEF